MNECIIVTKKDKNFPAITLYLIKKFQQRLKDKDFPNKCKNLSTDFVTVSIEKNIFSSDSTKLIEKHFSKNGWKCKFSSFKQTQTSQNTSWYHYSFEMKKQ